MKHTSWKRSTAFLLSMCLVASSAPAVFASETAAELPVTTFSTEEIAPPLDFYADENQSVAQYALPESIAVTDNFLFLSDLTPTLSDVYWKALSKDKNQEGGTLSLLVDGTKTNFTKGLGAHAPSTVTYDLSEISPTHTRLIGYVGVNAAKNSLGDGITASVFVAKNTEGDPVWEKVASSDYLRGDTNALELDINLTGVQAISLRSTNKTNNSNADHTLWANMQLLKTDYVPGSQTASMPFKTLADYDAQLAAVSTDAAATHAKLIYSRAAVARLGYDTLSAAFEQNEKNQAALRWLFDSEQNLIDFVTAGTIVGSTANSIKVLSSLYNAYKDILSGTDGAMYTRWILAMATGNAGDVKLWVGQRHVSDPVKRFAAYKSLLENNMLTDPTIIQTIPTSQLKYLFDSEMADEEIQWLVDRTNRLHKSSRNPYQYIRYSTAHTYVMTDEYKSMDNYAKWNEKYDLEEYGIQYDDGDVRLWRVFEGDGMCGTISKVGTLLESSYGFPSLFAWQPTHASYLTYSVKDGQGVWNVGNDIFGWAVTGTGSMPLDWGTGDGSWNANYAILSQKAIDNYSVYLQANVINLLANSYTSEAQKQAAYQAALEIQPYNLDAIKGLIASYQRDTTKTSADFLKLAKHITTHLQYYPNPMVYMLQKLDANLTNTDKIEADILMTNALINASNATAEDVVQDNVCRNIANTLLGTNSVETATFSFDGENAGQIVLADRYNGMDVNVIYSLDGTPPDQSKSTKAHKIQLTAEELKSIRSDTDIIVGFAGTSTSYTIDIIDSQPITDATVWTNDQENLLIGATDFMEYSLDDGENWIKYDGSLKSNTRIEGDQTVLARYYPHGNVRGSDESKSFTFTADTDTETKKYLQMQHVSLHLFSSENSENHAAAFMVDGNGNTGWHSVFGAKDSRRLISVALDNNYHINGVSYLSTGTTGKFKSGIVNVSQDGIGWTKVATFTDLPNDNTVKNIAFDEPSPARFIQIQATETYGGDGARYISGNMLWLYYDSTKGQDDINKGLLLVKAKNQAIDELTAYAKLDQYSGDERFIMENELQKWVDYVQTCTNDQAIAGGKLGGEMMLDSVRADLQEAVNEAALQEEQEKLETLIGVANVARMGIVRSLNGVDVPPEQQWVAEKYFANLEEKLQEAADEAVNEKARVITVQIASANLNAALNQFKEMQTAGLMSEDIANDPLLLAKTSLLQAISDANPFLDKSETISSADGSDVPADKKWALPADIDNFRIAITEAQSAHDLPSATPDSINEALDALKTAQQTFEGLRKAGTLVEEVLSTFQVQYNAAGTASVTNSDVLSDRKIFIIRAFYDENMICIGTKISQPTQDMGQWTADGFTVPTGTVSSKTYVLCGDHTYAPLLCQTDKS